MTTAVAGRAAPAWLARLLAAVPLALVYGAAAAAYSWQVSRQRSPWIFPDESQYGHVAAAIAGAGSAAIAPLWGILYSVLISPAWILDNPVSSYDVAKVINVLAMCATAVPAYLLARLFVRRPLALGAAAAAIAIPGMAYASLLMQEALAYPYATFVLYLLTDGLVRARRGSLVLTFALALAGPLVRTELLVLPLIVLFASTLQAWLGEPMRSRRGRWTGRHWAGAAAAAVGIFALGVAVVLAVSASWRIAIHHPGSLVRYAVLGIAPLTIGVGILPVLATPAVLAAVRRDRALRALTVVLVSAFAVFLVYVAGKETFISTRPGNGLPDLLGERNLLYMSPLFFTGTVIWMQARRVSAFALASASAILLLVLGLMPYPFASRSSPHSPTSVSVAHIAYGFGWGHTAVRAALLVATILAALVAWTLTTGRARAAAAPVLAVVGGLLIGWNLVGEVNASDMSRDIGRGLIAVQPRPLDWVDRLTGGRPALFLGQGGLRAPEILSLAYWNPSITKVWSLQGTPARYIIDRTYVASAGGRLRVPRRFRYVVADRDVEVAGTPIGRGGRWTVYRVRHPVRLRAYQAGVWEDGWMGSASSYTRFSGHRGRVFVDLSVRGWCGPDVGTRARIVVGRPLEGNHHLLLGRVRTSLRAPLHACKARTFIVPTPDPPFRLQVQAAPTFVPARLARGSPDTRHLSAQVSFRFEAAR